MIPIETHGLLQVKDCQVQLALTAAEHTQAEVRIKRVRCDFNRLLVVEKRTLWHLPFLCDSAKRYSADRVIGPERKHAAIGFYGFGKTALLLKKIAQFQMGGKKLRIRSKNFSKKGFPLFSISLADEILCLVEQ